MTTEEIVTDKEINEVWQNADFGSVPRRDVIKFALLKAACKFGNGHTSECIIQELGLVGKSHMKSATLTAKGRKYLWAAFGKPGY